MILDEVQRVPNLFSYLQTKTDADRVMGQYVLSGSQNFLLMDSITQSLAGRVALLKLFPFSFEEVEASGIALDTPENTLFTGFYPALFDRNIRPQDYYPNYIETYLERDVQRLINTPNLRAFQIFLKACAGHVGQLINYTSLADLCGISIPTAKSWMGILERSYVIFTLMPYYRNFSKRLVKTPKLYFYDTGLACHLLGIQETQYVETYYQRGSLFENLVIAELLKQVYHRGDRPAFYFWRDNHQVEVDLLWERNLQMHLLEIKASRTLHNRFFKPLQQLSRYAKDQVRATYLVYAGTDTQQRQGTHVLGWSQLHALSL